MIHIEIGSPVESDLLQAELPDGLTVENTGKQYFEFDATGFSLFLLTLGIVGGIPAGVVANAIYDAIRKRAKAPPTRMIIDKQHVEFDRGKITRVIHERIEYHRGSTSGERGKRSGQKNVEPFAPTDRRLPSTCHSNQFGPIRT